MRKILFFLLLVADSVSAELYDWKVEKVLDGDTIKFSVDFLPPPLPPSLSVRISGVDTPEKKPKNKCQKEDLLAQKASDFVKERIVNAQSIKVKLKGWDKYGGRVLGDIFIDGSNLSQVLIEKGLAREYHGESKSNWCE